MSTIVRRHPAINAVYGFLTFVVPLVVTFVTLPFFIRGLGVERYGLYVFLLTIGNLVSMVDVGLFYEWYHRLARYDGDNEEQNRELSTVFGATVVTYVIAACIAIVILMIGYGIAGAVGSFRSVVADASVVSLVLLVLLTAVRLVSVPFASIAPALQRFDIAAAVSVGSLAITQGAGVVVVSYGGGVHGLLGVQLLSLCITFVVWCCIKQRLLRHIHWCVPRTWAPYAVVLRAGFWIAIQNGSQTILAQFDKLVLGFLHGPAAVTTYANAQILPEKIVGTVNSTGGMLFPFFSRAAHERHDDLGRLFVRTIRMSTTLVCLAGAGLFAYGPVFLRLWLGHSLAAASMSAFFVLIITYAFLAWESVVVNTLFGLRATKKVSWYTTLLALANVVTLIVLIPRYGVFGAAVAYALAVVPVPLFMVATARRLDSMRTMANVIKQAIWQLIKNIAVAMLSVCIPYFLISQTKDSWVMLFTASGLSILIYASFVIGTRLILPLDDRMIVLNLGKKLRQKFVTRHE